MHNTNVKDLGDKLITFPVIRLELYRQVSYHFKLDKHAFKLPTGALLYLHGKQQHIERKGR
jgi:hypothetical protein